MKFEFEIELSTANDDLTAEDRAALDAEYAATCAATEALEAACTHSHELSLLGEDGCEHCGFYAK